MKFFSAEEVTFLSNSGFEHWSWRDHLWKRKS